MADILTGAGFVGVRKGSSYPYDMRVLFNFSQIEFNITEEGGEDISALRPGGSVVVASTPGTEKAEVSISNIDFVVPALEVLLNAQAQAAAAQDFPWNEAYDIPTGAPYEVTIPKALVVDTEYVVAADNWEQFTRVGSSPSSAGEFYPNGTTVEFHSGDAGRTVVIGGSVTSEATAQQIGGLSATSLGALYIEFYTLTNQNQKVAFVFPEATPQKELSLLISAEATEVPINFNLGVPTGWAKAYKIILEQY